MKDTIWAFEKDFTIIGKAKLEYAGFEDHTKAYKNLDELENLLTSMKFKCIEPRENKWGQSKFLKVTHPSGRYITIDTYFKDKTEGIKRSSSVNYNLFGVVDDYNKIIDKISNYKNLVTKRKKQTTVDSLIKRENNNQIKYCIR
jgi:hypothetical protein